MSYRQITSDERYLISTLRKQGFNPSQTATILGRHRSSITREIRRNATAADGGYRPFTASERTRGRRSRSRRHTRFTRQQWGCVHRWLLDSPNGPTVMGRCRCGAERWFPVVFVGDRERRPGWSHDQGGLFAGHHQRGRKD